MRFVVFFAGKMFTAFMRWMEGLKFFLLLSDLISIVVNRQFTLGMLFAIYLHTLFLYSDNNNGWSVSIPWHRLFTYGYFVIIEAQKRVGDKIFICIWRKHQFERWNDFNVFDLMYFLFYYVDLFIFCFAVFNGWLWSQWCYVMSWRKNA